MHAYDIKFAASAVEEGKQLVGNLSGVFDNDTQMAEYFRAQAKSLLEYSDRQDEIVEERRLRLARRELGLINNPALMWLPQGRQPSDQTRLSVDR